MRRLLVLAELLSPQRYPVCLVGPGTAAHAASPTITGRDAVGPTGCPGSAVAATLGTSYSCRVSDGKTAAAAAGGAAADALFEAAARCSQPDDLQPDAVQMADEVSNVVCELQIRQHVEPSTPGCCLVHARCNKCSQHPTIAPGACLPM